MANPDLLKPLTKSKRQELATLTRFGTSLFASQCYPEAGLFACVRNGGVHRNMLICHHSTLGGYSIWCHAQVRTWGEGALLREACTTAEKCNCQAHWLLDASSMSWQLCFFQLFVEPFLMASLRWGRSYRLRSLTLTDSKDVTCCSESHILAGTTWALLLR